MAAQQERQNSRTRTRDEDEWERLAQATSGTSLRLLRTQRFVGEGFKEGDEGVLVGSAQWEAAVGMFGDVRIERGAALHAGAVVFHDLFEGGESAVVHVGARRARRCAGMGTANLPLSPSRPVTGEAARAQT